MSNSLNLKVNKNEVELALNQKAEKSEMNKLAGEFKNLIQKKASNEQLNQLLSDKISKSEFLFHLSNKPSTEDINNILEEKIGIREFEEIIKEIELIKNEKLNTNIFNSEIREIKQLIENKPNSIDVVNALDTKVDKEDLKNDLYYKVDKKEMNNILREKVNKNDFDKINKTLDSKMNKIEFKKFENLTNILKEKADNKDFTLINEAFLDMKLKMTKRIDDIDNDLDRLIENIKSQFQSLNDTIKKIENNQINTSIIEKINDKINKKVDLDIMEETITKLKNNIYNSLNSFMTDLDIDKKKFEEKIIRDLDAVSRENQSLIDNINLQNINMKDLFEKKNIISDQNDKNYQKIYELTQNIQLKNDSKIEGMRNEIKKDMESLINVINKKIDTETLNDCLAKLENELNSKLDSLEYQENQDKIITDINKKIKELYDDITKELSEKIAKDEIKILIEDKINKISEENEISVKNLEKLKKYLEDIEAELNKKLNINAFNKIIKQFNTNFDNIKNDIKIKADSKDIIEALKTKVNTEQINKIYNDINDINNELKEKTNNIDFTSAIDNQAIINDTLCNENNIGRWVWRSGKIKSSYSVPWESQSINTSPDNFIWEKDKTYIIINEEGLYELNFGFFSEKKPNIQVLVNGVIIINSQNNSFSANNNALTYRKNSEYNYENITGLSVIEFIKLQKQSKLSVCYNGGIGTGFIGLKKL